MKKFGDDWHTAEDIVEEIFVDSGEAKWFLSKSIAGAEDPAASQLAWLPQSRRDERDKFLKG